MTFVMRYHSLLASPSGGSLPEGYEDSLDSVVCACADILARHLAELHGPVVDFASLLRPFYYLYSFQYANGSYITPEEAAAEPVLEPFRNLFELSEVTVNGWLHRVIYRLATADDPLAAAIRLLEHIPSPRGPLQSCDASQGNGEAMSRIGISLSLTILEKLLLKMRHGQALRFIKAEKEGCRESLKLHAQARRQLLSAVASDPAVAALGEKERRLLLGSILVLPTYCIEDFAANFADARLLMRGIKTLVCGIEFTHKPPVAVGLALLRERGGGAVGSQHGGFYGQTDATWLERAERSIFNCYATWGFDYGAGEHPMPSIRLSRFRVANAWQRMRRHLGRVDSNAVLVVLPNITRALAYGIHSPNILKQQESLKRSLEILEPFAERNCRIILRMHPRNVARDYEPSLPAFLRDRVVISHGKRGSLGRDAQRFGYVVFTNPNATGLSESVANNIDFLIVAEPSDYCIRSGALPAYQALRDAGIWITEAGQLDRSLAAKADGERTRDGYSLFAQMFAKHSIRYLHHWSVFVRQLAKS